VTSMVLIPDAGAVGHDRGEDGLALPIGLLQA
jgi:hypothetical protein